MVQIIRERMNIIIGNNPERKTFKKEGEGVKRVNCLSLTKQSNDTKGVEDDPSLSAGMNISLITFG